jgi:hypothetical protein
MRVKRGYSEWGVEDCSNSILCLVVDMEPGEWEDGVGGVDDFAGGSMKVEVGSTSFSYPLV